MIRENRCFMHNKKVKNSYRKTSKQQQYQCLSVSAAVSDNK
jgi:hypothetical protein